MSEITIGLTFETSEPVTAENTAARWGSGLVAGFSTPAMVALMENAAFSATKDLLPEGQTTVGEETVIGPGCRIIDSWVGSGVELKGWNYISRTSVRNRAILEPNARRGFD